MRDARSRSARAGLGLSLLGLGCGLSACVSLDCPVGYTKQRDQCVSFAPTCDGEAGECPSEKADAALAEPCQADPHGPDCLDSHVLGARSFGGQDYADFKGEAQSRGVDLASDDQGNVYVVGQFAGTTRFGETALTSRGLMDGFVAKFDADLTPIWATATLATAGMDSSHFVAVDSHHEVWVLSCTPLEPYTSLASLYSVELQKYNADGSLQRSIPISMRGSLWTQEGQMLVVDADDNLYMAFDFYGALTLAGQSVSTAEPLVNIDSLIAKFTPDGTLLWIKTYGGTLHTAAHNLEIVQRAGQQRLLLAGAYLGSIDRNVPSVGPDAMSTSDGFVLELDLDGQGLQLTTDGNDTALERWDAVTGTTLLQDGRLFVAAVSLKDLAGPGTSDGWLGLYDAQGAALSPKLIFGASGEDGPLDQMVLSDGRIAIVGAVAGLSNLRDTSPVVPTPQHADLLLAVYDDRGDHLALDYSGTYGGPGADRLCGLTQGPSGALYATGMITGVVSIGDVEVGTPDMASILLLKLSP